jgi:translation initiation factor 3 subunit M
MATEAPPNLLMVEGTFEDQIYELAAYIEGLKNVEPGSLANVLQPLVEKDDKEAVIKTLVDAASVLMKAPEKGLLAFRLS